MRQTTRPISSTRLEKSSSLVYCLWAVASKSWSRGSGARPCSKAPRSMTLTGLSATNRSKIESRSIPITSLRRLDLEGRGQVSRNQSHLQRDGRMGHTVTPGDALQSARAAKTLRWHGGKVVVTDGPFAETKE